MMLMMNRRKVRYRWVFVVVVWEPSRKKCLSFIAAVQYPGDFGAGGGGFLGKQRREKLYKTENEMLILEAVPWPSQEVSSKEVLNHSSGIINRGGREHEEY